MMTRTPLQNKLYQRAYRKRRLAWATELLGGKCVVCGATKGLDFHHKPGTKRNFCIVSRLTFSKARLVAELKKCELRCGSCHTDAHFPTRKEHGTNTNYRRGCRCVACTNAAVAYVQNLRNKNRRAYNIYMRDWHRRHRKCA